MSVASVLVTGGCGFVGSSLALRYKDEYPAARVVCLDNLRRRGAELNIPRLRERGVEFLHGDIRNPEDLDAVGDVELLIECSAEPSVLAGYGGSPAYVVNTNLVGTLNCLEFARIRKAGFLFLSTSRVYPMAACNALDYVDTPTRFELSHKQTLPGASSKGVSESFPLEGARSLYGTTKLASELVIQEYVDMYGLKAWINRCGVLAGPWQFGKVDQGVVVLWMAKHYWKQSLSYIGFGGMGKQVRDILHIDDLYDLIDAQLSDLNKHVGQVYNVGGSREISVSLRELTELCRTVTGNVIDIPPAAEDRPADIRIYLSDTTKVQAATGWRPTRSTETILLDIHDWMQRNETALQGILR
jgi:CDP-paratose 2-epimerase